MKSSHRGHESSAATVSVENYLKAIFQLEDARKERVTTKALAVHLGISLPSVTGMLKGLADAQLVDYQRYQGVRLLAKGRRQALRVIRKHRLVESFLVRTLGYTWDEVHAEAELLEHAVSDELAARIERHLDYPTHDPHGDPIPAADGTLRRSDDRTLVEVEAGETVIVRRALEQSPQVLRYLQQQGLEPDARVRVVERLPFDGPLKLATARGEAVLARQLAKSVVVDAAPSSARTTRTSRSTASTRPSKRKRRVHGN